MSKVGWVIDRITVVDRFFKEGKAGKKREYYLCRCECGTEKLLHTDSIRNSSNRKRHPKSCGCLLREASAKRAKNVGRNNKTHGMSGTRIYRIWSHMKERCNSVKDKDYKNYGGRGITYDQRWELFKNFFEDMKDDYREYLTLERKDVNGNYCKENCTWIPMKEQSANRRHTKKNRG